MHLRQRADRAGMTHEAFLSLFNAALKSGDVEADQFGNVKLMIDEPKKYYKTEVKTGVKPTNNLCEAILADCQTVFEIVESDQDFEAHLKQVLGIIERNRAQFQRCGCPFISKFTNARDGSQSLVIYASERVYTSSQGHFLQIRVVED